MTRRGTLINIATLERELGSIEYRLQGVLADDARKVWEEKKEQVLARLRAEHDGPDA